MQVDTEKQSVRRRPERLFVSLNAREKALIEEAATGAQLNMTEWARTVLLSSAKREAKRVRRDQRGLSTEHAGPEQFARTNSSMDQM